MTAITAGLSAFPLSPLVDDVVDQAAFVRIVERAAAAGVDSITVLGSTGCGPYLTRKERARVVRLAVGAAGDVPVYAGVSALGTSRVLVHAEQAEAAGARGLLVAPQSYQALTDDDVAGLYADVARSSDLPVIVYDNPATTHVRFSTELYGRVAELPGVASIKIPALPAGAEDAEAARARVEEIRAVLPAHVGVGVSGDAAGAAGLLAGCDAWYSVIAGTLPEVAVRIARAAQAGAGEGPEAQASAAEARAEADRLAPLWELFTRHGSLRVTAAIAEHLGLARASCLPLPIRGLGDADRAEVAGVVEELGLG